LRDRGKWRKPLSSWQPAGSFRFILRSSEPSGNYLIWRCPEISLKVVPLINWSTEHNALLIKTQWFWNEWENSIRKVSQSSKFIFKCIWDSMSEVPVHNMRNFTSHRIANPQDGKSRFLSTYRRASS
jgi:hypothetical protein